MSVNELQALTQQFADAFEQRDLKTFLETNQALGPTYPVSRLLVKVVKGHEGRELALELLRVCVGIQLCCDPTRRFCR
jgi:hypothetical protein